jgi:hypothetical protein
MASKAKSTGTICLKVFLLTKELSVRHFAAPTVNSTR